MPPSPNPPRLPKRDVGNLPEHPKRDAGNLPEHPKRDVGNLLELPDRVRAADVAPGGVAVTR